TPLHVAVEFDNNEAASLLVEKGASINAVDSEGFTLLLMRATTLDMAEHLVILGARTADMYRMGRLDDLI
ncbi:hypothetical protein B0H67DRAFT_482526, partial [Lasiosphaeris hirsuta]